MNHIRNYATRHAIVRFLERYGYSLTPRLCEAIYTRIQNGSEIVWLATKDKGNRYACFVRGERFIFVYNHETDMIITFLPPEPKRLSRSERKVLQASGLHRTYYCGKNAENFGGRLRIPLPQ